MSVAFGGGLELAARLVESPRERPAVAEYIWDWQERWDGDFYTMRSDATGWPPWEEFNPDGLRDRAHVEAKPEGTRRLVCLGDSVTLGDGLEPDQAYPQILQRLLDERGPGVEVMNVALWGWSTRQERLAYERIARRYAPDRVLLGVCLNDVPELQNNLARPPRLLAWLFERSALVRRVVDAPGREIASVEQLFREPDAPRVVEAFGRFEAELDALRAAVEADGAELAVAVFPFRFQLEPDAPEPVAQRRIARWCERAGVSCLDLLPALAELGPGALHDYDHLSATGARRVAEVLSASELVPQPLDARSLLEARDGAVESDPDRDAGGGASGPDLVAALAAPAPDVRQAAAWALGRRPETAAGVRGALAAALSDPAAGVRLEAARALGAAGQAAADAAPSLFAALSDPVPAVRRAAAEALWALGPRPAWLDPLVVALEHDDAFVRGFAAWSLGALGDAARPAVPALAAALERPEGFDRGGAATALGQLGEVAGPAVSALARGLVSPDPERRWKAARALGRVGTPAGAVAGALAAALSDADERVRVQAARSLGRVGPLDATATEALTRAARDPVAEVRTAAERTLRQLSER